MYGAILGDIIGSPYEFDAGEKTNQRNVFRKTVLSRSLHTTDSARSNPVYGQEYGHVPILFKNRDVLLYHFLE